MEADFSGYATKAGLKCSDGRTIMPDAFKHQDTTKVPLVWQHNHSDPENVLGHVILENRQDGVYAYGFFNDSAKAVHSRGLIQHKDITMMSIWANDLIERAKNVLHGKIREVSLVLSGANPGALIDNIAIRHSDDEDDTILEDEAIIYTGLSFEHTAGSTNSTAAKVDTTTTDTSSTSNDLTIQDVYDSMTEQQKEVLHYMIGEALSGGSDSSLANSAMDDGEVDTETQDVYDSLTDVQKEVFHFMVGEALSSNVEDESDLENSPIDEMAQNISHMTEMMSKMTNNTNDTKDNADANNADDTKGNYMKHNVFENKDQDTKEPVISHSDVKEIMTDAIRGGSLKDAIEGYALAHGITDVDVLFPDAVSLDSTPQFLQRRVEWVASFLSSARKSPFSRIKTLSADLTFEEARAKGYVKGSLKRDEFFGIVKRVSTPTTVYKKQSLDRDDIVDITDFDVVVWLKSEMRVMLDEELARAALMGDGRDISHEDKISESNIRPIAKENDVFATTITVNIDDANSSIQEVIDQIVANRKYYRGTGQPNMYTSETMISMFLLLRDTVGRRIYKDLSEVASELRVAAIIPVEVMEEDPDLIAVIVNPVDYVFGATAGGQVSMFDDFDIDYNKQKYLIETRCCGALTKLKSALVVRKTVGTNVLVSPTVPTFNEATGALSIPTVAGVVYTNADTNTVVNAAGSPYTVPTGTTRNIVATPASGYYFATSEDDSWAFTAE